MILGKKNTLISLTRFVMIILSFAFIHCGKSVTIENPPTTNTPGGISPTTPTIPGTTIVNVNPCGSNTLKTWDFTQPVLGTVQQKVDILFVVDTSDSLQANRPRVAAAVSNLTEELPTGADFRIGIILAHGGASPYSGQLYSAADSPIVLDSKSQSLQDIQTNLESSLANVPEDFDEANGEMMMYSLLKSLEPENLQNIQSQGFYRSDAALAVVFITDENDVCYPSEFYGYTTFPDYAPSVGNYEMIAYQRYCAPLLAGGKKILDLVPAQLAAVKKDKPVTLSGIIHFDPARVPYIGEQSISHGIVELLQNSLNSNMMEIADTDYTAGLAKIGSLVSLQMQLLTLFHLDTTQQIQTNTIAVKVNQTPVLFQFQSPQNNVLLKAADAGAGGALIEVTACVQ